jgi:hypothetical protein
MDGRGRGTGDGGQAVIRNEVAIAISVYGTLGAQTPILEVQMSPQKLNQFPQARGQSRYNWDQLLDGAPWELVAGSDFTGKPETFLANARNQAGRRGGRLRTRHFAKEHPGRVVIQFISD